MKIKFSDAETGTAGFISWHRLATSLFPNGGETKPNETIVRMEADERGIHYYLTFPSTECK